MPLVHDSNAPYAPAATVIDVIKSFRDGSFRGSFTKESLLRLGVTESLAPRTLQALQLLDLVDDAGAPTEKFTALRKAPADQYQAAFADLLRSAYAAVFEYLPDPSKATHQQVHDAFRGFKPEGQWGRMVTLFLSLIVEAGIIEEAPKPKRTTTPGKRSGARQPKATAPKAATPKRTTGGGGGPATFTPAAGSLPPALSGLLAQLPAEGWTQERRDAFVATFKVVLDFCIPIRDDDDNGQDEADEEEVQ